jgi:hypothetical protein
MYKIQYATIKSAPTVPNYLDHLRLWFLHLPRVKFNAESNARKKKKFGQNVTLEIQIFQKQADN